MKIEKINAMPAPTWRFLKMNFAELELPEGLEARADVQAAVPADAVGAPGALEAALAEEQAAWEAEHPAPTAEELAERAAVLAAEADATYGGTAQSTYQKGADELEEARSLAAAFQSGMGAKANAALREAAGEPVVIAAQPGASVDAQVIVRGAAGALSVAVIDVVAAAGSTVNLSIVVEGEAEAADGDEVVGAAGTVLRVLARANARVNVVRTQALSNALADLDDIALFTAEGARIDLRQTVLGAGTAYAGLAGDLRGASSDVRVDTRYLGYEAQKRDFNYVLRHHGVKTTCTLKANGVLANTSSKTLRGTIDLIRGAKGAEGQETETVLLVDDGVRNKTVPVILCNEDDVAGNHGATIGHIRPEQMFYLASRGLSQTAAERMFVGAMVEQAYYDAPDEQSRAAVLRLGERVKPGFAEDFE